MTFGFGISRTEHWNNGCNRVAITASPTRDIRDDFNFNKHMVGNAKRSYSSFSSPPQKRRLVRPNRFRPVSPTRNEPFTPSPRRAMLAQSPGGTEYIVTPGRHRINLNDFLGTMDMPSLTTNPALAAISNYGESMFKRWLERERQIPSAVFMLSFKKGCAMEQFRLMAIQGVFSYAIEQKLHEKTVHLTCFNICRLVYGMFIETKGRELTQEILACIVMAALRNAIKNDEAFSKSDIFRLDPDHVWRSCPFLSNACPKRSVELLNRVEAESLRHLESPANPPLCPEFLDRYIIVGGWREYSGEYRELGAYLIGLALFANASSAKLRSIPNSKLSAAALVLAIKIVNTDASNVKYEFWPERLVRYTSFSLEELKPVIKGLAYLLRNKPKWSNVLERYYGKWGAYDWN